MEQGHEVHAVYQTSGNIAVFDDYLYEMMDIADLFSPKYGSVRRGVQAGEGDDSESETGGK